MHFFNQNYTIHNIFDFFIRETKIMHLSELSNIGLTDF